MKVPLAKLTNRQAHWLIWPSAAYYAVALLVPDPLSTTLMTGLVYWGMAVVCVLLFPLSLAFAPLVWWLW